MKRVASKITMSVESTSKLIGVSYVTTLRAVKRGQLPCIRVGDRFFVLRKPLERMLRGQKEPTQ